MSRKTVASAHLVIFGTLLLMLASTPSVGLAQCPTRDIFEGNLEQFSQFGYSISSAGFVDADEYPDMVVGQPFASSDSSGTPIKSGCAFVMDGNSLTWTRSIWEICGEHTGDLFGFAVGGGVDITGDAIPDFVIGAPGHAVGRGRVYVYSGADNSLLFEVSGEFPLDSLGYSVAITNDLNNDGLGDIVFGAPRHGSVGRAYIIFGQPTGSTIVMNASASDLILDGVDTGELFGTSVAGVGDWNGDGNPDVIVGAPGWSSFVGKATLFGANNSLTTISSIFGQNSFEHFGWSVADAGDVDADCFGDIIIGAPGYDTTIVFPRVDVGRAVVILGPNSDESVFLEVVGDTTGDSLGYDVATAGNHNLDGYDDILIGSPGIDESRGGVFIFHGGANALGRKNYGQADHGHFEASIGVRTGLSVTNAGDVELDDADEQAYARPLFSTGNGQVKVMSCFSPANGPRSVNMDDVGLGDKLLFRWSPPIGAGQQSYIAWLLNKPITANSACDGSIVQADTLHKDTAFVVFNNLGERTPYYCYVKLIDTAGKHSKWESVPNDSAVYASTPVVCVHGLNSSEATWIEYDGWLHGNHFNVVWVANNLKKFGVPTEEHFGGNAELLSDYIETQIQLFKDDYDQYIPGYNITNFDIVSHSMGGLISRRYVSESSAGWGMKQKNRQVDKLIALASPHLGTNSGEILKQLLDAMKRYNLATATLAYLIEFLYPAPIEMSLTNMIYFEEYYSDHNGVDVYAGYATGGRDNSFCSVESNTGCSKALRLSTYIEVCPNDGVVNIASAQAILGVAGASGFSSICHDGVTGDSLMFTEYTLSVLEGGAVPSSFGARGAAPQDTTTEEQLQVMYQVCDTISGAFAREDTIHVTEYGRLVVALTGPSSRLTCRLKGPDGAIWDSAYTEWRGWPHLYADDSLTRGYVIQLVEGITDTGQWIVDYQRADSLMPFCLTVGLIPAGSGITTMVTSLLALDPCQIDTVTILATLSDPSGFPIVGAFVSVNAQVEAVDSTYFLLEDTLWDDGAHGDGAALDGVYGYQRSLWMDSGLYSFFVEASGVVASDSFSRQGSESVYISGCGLDLLCCDIAGDIDHNGIGYELTDMQLLVDLLTNGIECDACLPLLDVNGDCVINSGDVDKIVDVLFSGGTPAPCSDCVAFTFSSAIDPDSDGVPNGCDICPGFDDAADADGDGVPDGCDSCPTEPDPCPSCCDTPGDSNNDGTFNIGDITFLIARIFSGGVAPDCQDEADANGSNSISISDVTYGIARIFSGGPAPVCGTTGS